MYAFVFLAISRGPLMTPFDDALKNGFIFLYQHVSSYSIAKLVIINYFK